MKMRKLLANPKYDGYKIKCKTCRCGFFVPFEDVRSSGIWDEYAYVKCPICDKKIEQSIFWKKHKVGEDQ